MFIEKLLGKQMKYRYYQRSVGSFTKWIYQKMEYPTGLIRVRLFGRIYSNEL